MPRFSLIVATVSRTTELKILFESLIEQRFSDYELIVVDQNQDDRLGSVIDEFRDQLPVTRITSPKGCSVARNAGLAVASGEIIAFPDDDCWYSAGLLRNIDQWFRTHPKYSILAVGALDEAGIPSGNRWVQAACDLHPVNIFRTTFCSSLFMRKEALGHMVFDEGIGPGSSRGFHAGDETDFVLNILNAGFRGRFDRTWHIGHPRRDMLSHSVSTQRAASYGSGMGHVLRKHSLYALWAGLLGYDLARALIVVLRGRLASATLCFAHARGLLRGFSASLMVKES